MDECSSSGTNHCDQAANCTNSEGSFQCICQDGYSGNGTACEGIDFLMFSLCTGGGGVGEEEKSGIFL